MSCVGGGKVKWDLDMCRYKHCHLMTSWSFSIYAMNSSSQCVLRPGWTQSEGTSWNTSAAQFCLLSATVTCGNFKTDLTACQFGQKLHQATPDKTNPLNAILAWVRCQYPFLHSGSAGSSLPHVLLSSFLRNNSPRLFSFPSSGQVAQSSLHPTWP